MEKILLREVSKMDLQDDRQTLKEELDKFVKKMELENNLFSSDPEVIYMEIKRLGKRWHFGR